MIRFGLQYRSHLNRLAVLGVMLVAVVSGYVIIMARASTALPSDVNNDGKVDVFDLSALLAGWGKNGATDVNGDGTTDIFDLSLLLGQWSETPAGTTPTPTPAPTPLGTPVAGGALNLPRIPWEGGPAYWAQFPKAAAAGWTNPSFFPISVFLGKPSQAAALKAVGVNTYMGAEHDGSAISTMTGQGMYVIAQTEWTQAEVGNDGKAVGWFVSDECDIGLGCSGGNAAGDLTQQKAAVAKLRAYGDGRFMQANYSNGVLDSYWAQGTMAGLMAAVDVASDDKYFYSSPFVDGQVAGTQHWPAGANPVRSGAYGWLIDQMRSFQATPGVHPNWIFVEAAEPLLNDAGSLTITVPQLEGADWSAIIHEARGIAYFQHNNGTVCGYYSLVDCDATRLAQIKAINDSIQALAPIINTQSYQYSFGTGLDTMLKTYQGSAYIFSQISLTSQPGSRTFTLPPGITGTTVTVVNENRTLQVVGGKFTDSFAQELTHHIYKVSL